MRDQLTQYVNLLFAGNTDAEDIRMEILQNTLDRYDDLISQGKTPEAAYRLAISGIGDIGEQTAQSMRNIEAILAEAGCTLKDVVKTTIFLKDLGDFAQVNAAYAAFFPGNAPARACVQVAKLPKDARVEIEAIAAKQG